MRTGWLLVLAACTSGEKFNGAGDGGDGPSGPYPTEVAVENTGTDTVTVTLTGDDGEVTIADVAAGTTSEPVEIDWEILDAVEVTIDAGTAQGGTIDLSSERENVVRVSPTEAPEVETHVQEQPSGGDPNGGGGGGGGAW
jgi:hypothetical protein